MTDNYLEQVMHERKQLERREALLASLPKCWTGKEIMHTEFPPIKWAVNGLIPAGAILFSGAFKIGKSWAMLQLCDCVSRGRPFLGRETTKGAALYLALEDGPRRIHDRASKMGIVLAENVYVFNDWPAGSAGLDCLDAWLEEHSGTRIVIIDTLSRWRDDYHGSDIWQRDTLRIANLKTIADRRDTTILIVHHRSKAAREDAHMSVAGTNALQGAADGSIILEKKRGENLGKLSILGRDVPEAEIAVEFLPESCTWKSLDGDPVELMLNEERRAVIEAIRELGGKAKPGQIAELLGKKQPNISKLCSKLADEGMIVSVGYGTYAIHIPMHSSNSGNSEPSSEENTMPTITTMPSISTLDNLFDEGSQA